MKLELINGDYQELPQLNLEQIKYNLIKSTIKKDIEVVIWQNKAIKVFGEFQIYSDFKSELNCFEHFVSYFTGKTFNYVGESIEARVTCRCPEHFLDLLITKGKALEDKDVESLAVKYTLYLLEAIDLINLEFSNNLVDQIILLDKKYFSGNDPTVITRFLSPNI